MFRAKPSVAMKPTALTDVNTDNPFALRNDLPEPSLNLRSNIFDKIHKEIMGQREEILRAIVAKYGIDDPLKLQQVIHDDMNGSIKWSVVINTSKTLKHDD